MNNYNRSYRHRTASSDSAAVSELLAKLIICAVLFCAAFFLKYAFPEAAETVSSAVLGDDSYREVFAQLGGAETVSEVFAAITGAE